MSLAEATLGAVDFAEDSFDEGSLGIIQTPLRRWCERYGQSRRSDLRRSVDERPDRVSFDRLKDIPKDANVEDDDGQFIVHTQRHRRAVHDFKSHIQ